MQAIEMEPEREFIGPVLDLSSSGDELGQVQGHNVFKWRGGHDVAMMKGYVRVPCNDDSRITTRIMEMNVHVWR